MDIAQLQHGTVVRSHDVDTTSARERQRQRRLWKLVVLLGIPTAWFWIRELSGNPVRPGLPAIIRESPELALLVVLMSVMMLLMLVLLLNLMTMFVMKCRCSECQQCR